MSAPAAKALSVPVITIPAMDESEEARRSSASRARRVERSSRGMPAGFSRVRRRIVSFRVARRVVPEDAATGVSILLRGGGEALANEVDDVLGGSAGKKNFGDANFFQRGDVGFRNDAADEDSDVVHPFFAEEFHEAGAESVVRAGEDGEADDVHVFLHGGGGDHLRRLAEAGVDDFHASVAESAGDDFRAAVVTVEAGLGDEDADFFLSHRPRKNTSIGTNLCSTVRWLRWKI